MDYSLRPLTVSVVRPASPRLCFVHGSGLSWTRRQRYGNISYEARDSHGSVIQNECEANAIESSLSYCWAEASFRKTKYSASHEQSQACLSYAMTKPVFMRINKRRYSVVHRFRDWLLIAHSLPTCLERWKYQYHDLRLIPILWGNHPICCFCNDVNEMTWKEFPQSK